MRIVCLYNQLHPLTVKSIAAHAPDAEFVDTSGSDTAYWEAIAARWMGEDDLMLIEHDVEIHAQVIPQFDSCPELWCHFPYPYRGGLTTMATGCTRYRAALQRRIAVEEILAAPSYRGIPGHWEFMDVTIATAFSRKGVEVCDHSPPVGHRGQYMLCLPCMATSGRCLRGYPSAISCFHEMDSDSAFPSTAPILIPLLSVDREVPSALRIPVAPAPTWRQPVKRARMLHRERQRRARPL